jgi:hypothetical protein
MCLFTKRWLTLLVAAAVCNGFAAEKTVDEVCEVVALSGFGMQTNGCLVGETGESQEECGKKFFAGIGNGSWDGRYAGSGDPDEDQEGWVGACKLEFSEVFMEPCRKARFVWSGTACYDSAEDVPKDECLNKEQTYWGKLTNKCYPSPKARNEAETASKKK